MSTRSGAAARAGDLALKALRLVIVVLLVCVATFSLTALLPGDPAAAILGPAATPDQIVLIRTELGLDKPYPVQFGEWLLAVLRGDLGRSYVSGEPITTIIGRAAPITLELVVLAQIVALVIAIPAALLAAYRERSLTDRAVTSLAFVALSIPEFVVGLLLILIFAVQLDWFAASGFVPISRGLIDNLRSLALPTLTLALPLAAVYVRILRADLVTTLRTDFITMARAQGVPPVSLLLGHALRPSALSLVTMVGIYFGGLLGGAVVVEQIFALPGMGRITVNAISGRDYLVIQGIVLVVAIGYVLVNVLVDAMYTVIDPRARRSGAGLR